MGKCAAVLISLMMLTACSGPFPVERGYTMTVAPVAEAIPPEDKQRYATTLQLLWHGTSFYTMQLGEGTVVTDPFVSHYGPLHVALGGKLKSDQVRIEGLELGPNEPFGALIGHAHYDHMLDLDAIFDDRDWDDTVIVGSETVRNILAYDSDLKDLWKQAETGAGWHPLGNGTKDTQIHYRAFPAAHAPQIGDILFYPGKFTEEQDKPPTKAWHFRKGNDYAYLIRLEYRKTAFTVFMMSSASPWPIGLPTEDMLPVDVAILCVPSFDKAEGYPEEFVKALNARHIVLSHYNDFFDNDYGSPRTVPFADVQEFLRRVQAAAKDTKDPPRLEKIHVPDVGAVMLID